MKELQEREPIQGASAHVHQTLGNMPGADVYYLQNESGGQDCPPLVV